jgi:hypothetical protein
VGLFAVDPGVFVRNVVQKRRPAETRIIWDHGSSGRGRLDSTFRPCWSPCCSRRDRPERWWADNFFNQFASTPPTPSPRAAPARAFVGICRLGIRPGTSRTQKLALLVRSAGSGPPGRPGPRHGRLGRLGDSAGRRGCAFGTRPGAGGAYKMHPEEASTAVVTSTASPAATCRRPWG